MRLPHPHQHFLKLSKHWDDFKVAKHAARLVISVNRLPLLTQVTNLYSLWMFPWNQTLWWHRSGWKIWACETLVYLQQPKKEWLIYSENIQHCKSWDIRYRKPHFLKNALLDFTFLPQLLYLRYVKWKQVLISYTSLLFEIFILLRMFRCFYW